MPWYISRCVLCTSSFGQLVLAGLGNLGRGNTFKYLNRKQPLATNEMSFEGYLNMKFYAIRRSERNSLRHFFYKEFNNQSNIDDSGHIA